MREKTHDLKKRLIVDIDIDIHLGRCYFVVIVVVVAVARSLSIANIDLISPPSWTQVPRSIPAKNKTPGAPNGIKTLTSFILWGSDPPARR